MIRVEESPALKRSSTAFLQFTIVLIGLAVLAGMLWEPLTEGRNVHATLFQVYFQDPFLAYAYISSLAFFVGLRKAFQLLGYVAGNQTFSPAAVSALRAIKTCAFLTAVAIVAAGIYLRLTAHANDDPAGALMLGLIATFAAVVIGTAVAVLERVLRSAVKIKSENDLTV